MHIAIIANGFQEDYIINLLNGIAGKVEKIDFVGSSFYSKEKIDKRVNILNFRGDHTESVPVRKKIARILKYYSKLFRYYTSKNASVIHVQWLRLNLIEGLVFSILARISGKKTVYTAHDVLPHMKDRWYTRILFRLIYGIQDMIIVHTQFIHDRIRNEFNISQSKLAIVKHGVYDADNHHFITRNSSREKLGIDISSRVILFFGIITKYKGLDILLKSFNTLSEKNKHFRLIIAGRISNEYVNEFHEMLKEYDNANILKFLRFIENDEVEYLFKASDVVVLPYLEASQSGVLFMSYAYGRPVIAPYLGGFPDDIDPNKTGMLFTTGSPESLKETISEFDSRYSILFQNAEEYITNFARENYSWEASGIELMKIYEKISMH